MNTRRRRLSVTLGLTLALASGVAAQRPPAMPPVPEPPGNPITQPKALLGKALFWEEQMSSGRTMSCGTCHAPEAGGADPRASRPGSVHPGADGVFGTGDDVRGSRGTIETGGDGRFLAAQFGMDAQVTRRKAPSVINAAYERELFWDGRVGDRFVVPTTGATALAQGAALEAQAMLPPTSTVEMGFHGVDWLYWERQLGFVQPMALAENLPNDLAAFVAGRSYPQLFALAFGDPSITTERIGRALATYERTLVSTDSPFDRYVAGDPTALRPDQLRGMGLFFGRADCSQCHPAPHFTDSSYRNIGVRPWGEDPGRMDVTHDPADRGKFRVPGLRNVALRRTFFHNGSAANLTDAVRFYDRGGDFRDNLDPLMRPLQLGANEVAELVAFLEALTDPRVAAGLAPFDRPRLFTESQRGMRSFGRGTADATGRVPRAVVPGPPVLGNIAFNFGVANAPGGALGFAVLSSAADPQGYSLVGATVYPSILGAYSVHSIGALDGVGPGKGYGSLVIVLPAAPALRGAEMFGQWLLFDPATPSQIVASPAFALRLF